MIRAPLNDNSTPFDLQYRPPQLTMVYKDWGLALYVLMTRPRPLNFPVFAYIRYNTAGALRPL